MKKVAIVGYGEIARNVHEPTIRNSKDFELACTISINGGGERVPNFNSITDAINAGVDIELVSLCVPPVVRVALAKEAISHGFHILLEKPPAVDEEELKQVLELARERGLSVFTSWHSKYAPMVSSAKNLLTSKKLEKIEICWKENVEVWHPGQQWIWERGGYGVFDAGMNSFSIITEVLGSDLSFKNGSLVIELGKETPFKAEVNGCISGVDFYADFDWHWKGDDAWNIAFRCVDGDLIFLADGGKRLYLNDKEIPAEVDVHSDEYETIYARMANLIDEGSSDIHTAPMKICLDSLNKSEKRYVSPLLPDDIRILDSRKCVLGEGVFWHPQRRQLFWFDILEKKLLSIIDGNQLEWCFDWHVSAAGWIDYDRLLIASEIGLLDYNLDTRKISNIADVESLNLITRSNDGRTDRVGGFWFSTMGKSTEIGQGSIYRFYRGEVTRVAHNITIPNTICFSPEGRYVYFSDTYLQVVWRQELEVKTGVPIGMKEVWLDFTGTELYPDGGDVDVDGNIWIAFWGVGRVNVYNSDRVEVKSIKYPVAQISCPLIANGCLYTVSARDGLTDEQQASELYSGMTFEKRGDFRSNDVVGVLL